MRILPTSYSSEILYGSRRDGTGGGRGGVGGGGADFVVGVGVDDGDGDDDDSYYEDMDDSMTVVGRAVEEDWFSPS